MNPISPKNGKVNTIAKFLKGTIHVFVGVLIFSILNTVLNSLTPQIIRMTVDSIIGGQPYQLPQWLVSALQLEALSSNPGKALILASVAILFTSVLSGICSFFSRTGIATGSENFVKSMRDCLYTHIQKLPFSWHVQNKTGDIIQRCTSDVEVIRNFVCNQLIEVFRISFLIVFSISIMFSMNWKIALIALLFIPVIAAYSGIFYHKIAKRFLSADEAEGDLSAVVQENLTGVRVVRAFGRERFEIERFDEKNNFFSNLWIRLGSLMSLYWSIGDLITGLQILTVILVGVVESVNGNISLGEFLALVSYNATLAWPVRSLGRILSEMSKAGVSVDRVAYILDAQEEVIPPDALTPPMNQDICFEHINFVYEGELPVLQDINFTIPAGSTFAILGGTGSGKSTLMHLLNRLYELPPECGRITIGGVDIRNMSQAHLRKNIGVVLQEPFLYSRTIQENIGIARREAPLEKIRSAAKVACVDEAIENFTSGYDTVVGERGVTLSGGQKQRVAIARMLLQNTPIKVFDDSLSAVDSETDAKIRNALNESAGDSTVILISHRITTLMQADRILVLDHGKVSQIGTHEELISQEGIYRDIYDIQMNSADRALLEGGIA